MLAEFLAEQLFGRWSLVLHYDLGRGLRAFAGRDEKRLKEMVTLANRKVGDLSALPKDPAATFAILDRFVRNNVMAPENDRLSVAVIMDQASYVFPTGEPGRLNMQASSQLVTMLNWAMSPHVKRMNMAFVMIDEKLSDVSDRLAGNPHVATIEVPLPDQAAREAFIRGTTIDTPVKDFSDFDAFPDDNVNSPEGTMAFGRCKDDWQNESLQKGFDNPVELGGLPPTPGNCVTGGRVGYSVKMVSPSMLRSSAPAQPLGGPNTSGKILNPIPEDLLNQ